MYCKECGAEIKEGAEFCLSCGKFTNNNNEVVNTPVKNNPMALGGFVVALVSLLINLWGLVGLTGLILSIVGLIQIKANNGKGKGMAIAGIIIGAFSVVYAILLLAGIITLSF